jgi:hypothetical protein
MGDLEGAARDVVARWETGDLAEAVRRLESELENVGYNGWSNYETWAAALWIDNEQGSYAYSRELVAEAAEGSETPTVDAADALKEWAEETWIDPVLEDVATMAVDLLRGAFSEIDWHEIAGGYLSELEAEGADR